MDGRWWAEDFRLRGESGELWSLLGVLDAESFRLPLSACLIALLLAGGLSSYGEVGSRSK
jgi:hypothetical protein